MLSEHNELNKKSITALWRIPKYVLDMLLSWMVMASCVYNKIYQIVYFKRLQYVNFVP